MLLQTSTIAEEFVNMTCMNGLHVLKISQAVLSYTKIISMLTHDVELRIWRLVKNKELLV